MLGLKWLKCSLGRARRGAQVTKGAELKPWDGHVVRVPVGRNRRVPIPAISGQDSLFWQRLWFTLRSKFAITQASNSFERLYPTPREFPVSSIGRPGFGLRYWLCHFAPGQR